MSKVIDDSFMVCADCYCIVGSGDASAFDYWYSEEEADRRLHEVEECIASIQGIIYPGDFIKDEEFSRDDCDCCGIDLAGARHHCIILEE